MTSPGVEAYLRRLDRELRRCFVADATILDEVRGHLHDAVERERQLGRASEDAEREAIARFGAPEVVAAAYATDRSRALHRALLVAAVGLGIAIAYVDSRPTWDDTGVSAGALTIAAGVLGLLGPRRPWAWALGVGIWIPALAMVRTPAPGTLGMLLVLLFPFAGAYIGMALRRAITPAQP